MTRTLVSFLGRAKRDSNTGGYRTANYDFGGGEERTTSFFGLALKERVGPDRLVVLGTRGSMWDVLVNEFDAADEEWEQRVILSEAADAENVTQAMLDRARPLAERALGCVCELHLIPYGRDAAEQQEILTRISEAVPEGQVTLDLTHGFRHLAALLMRLGAYAEGNPDSLVDLFRDFSGAVSSATVAAAREATERVLMAEARHGSEARGDVAATAPMPARPIVLGGDDLTILLRADLAVPFTRAFLVAFESRSRGALTELRARYPQVQGLPAALTAGAGIAFVRSSHPFHLAHQLAESLARFAKAAAKRQVSGDRVPPTLAFHRVTTASHGEYPEILERELTLGRPGGRVRTTLSVYGVDADPSPLPALGDLEALTAALAADDVARGPARQILTLMGQDLDDARRRYARWREIMSVRDSDTEREINRLLAGVCGALREDLPVSRAGDPPATPLGDVATLLAVTTGAGAAGAAGTAEEENAG